MHVAIDTSPLENEHGGRGTGIYTKLLVEALEHYENFHTYSFFTRSQNIPKNADLVHYPYFDPFFLTLPLFHHKPFIVTVHDLIPIRFPDRFPRGLRGELKWRIQRKALAGAARIVTDSFCSKSDIARFVPYPQNRTDVVYLAPAGDYSPETDKATLLAVNKKYSLPREFFVYVGDVNWNKNVPGLLRAFKAIASGQVHLLLIGKAFLREDLPEVREIRRVIAHEGITASVRMPGFVPTADLRCLYSLARAAVFPSFYEGFGLPILEAMACEAPVIAANGSSLDEIAGPALRVDPSDTAGIARAMGKVLSMPEAQRKILARTSSTWAKKFTWEKVARETAASYSKVLHGS